MKHIILLLLFTYTFLGFTYSQSPKITGTIKISIIKGTIEGNMEVSNVPNISTYSIWLNAGLNIKYFRDSTDKFNYDFDKYYNSDKSGEAFQYILSLKDSVILPKKFKINYVGAFPVVTDTNRMSDRNDWKGNMAFNGKTFRASDQSAWYPILYDTTNDIIYDKVTYDVSVICKDCTSIYLNGSEPKLTDSASFKSEKPLGLLLFVGNYIFDKLDKAYFVNSELLPSEEKVLSDWTARITNYYEKKLKHSYGSNITYLGSTPLSKFNNWAFVTYPTFSFIGNKWNLKASFNTQTHQIKDSSDITFIAHELGHYYFGNSFIPNSDLKWFFLEGITDYLSIKVSKELLGDRVYKNIIEDYCKNVENFKGIPLNKIEKVNDINTQYRYNYIPLLLISLENQIGKENMWKWLSFLLDIKGNYLSNYAFFKSSIIKSGISLKEFTDFENTYIKANDSKERVLECVHKTLQ